MEARNGRTNPYMLTPLSYKQQILRRRWTYDPAQLKRELAYFASR
jgi:hypothetical protein